MDPRFCETRSEVAGAEEWFSGQEQFEELCKSRIASAGADEPWSGVLNR